MNLNKAQIIGRITNDIEMKTLDNGTAVISFSVATNRSWKDKDGAKKEEVEFHNVSAFGKPAELIAQYMGKGSQIYIEGRLRTRNWEDKDSGKKMYRTEIIVENFQFGASPNKEKGQGQGFGEYDTPAPEQDEKPEPKGKTAGKSGRSSGKSSDVRPEDIPF